MLIKSWTIGFQKKASVEVACSVWRIFDVAYTLYKFLENAPKICHEL